MVKVKKYAKYGLFLAFFLLTFFFSNYIPYHLEIIIGFWILTMVYTYFIKTPDPKVSKIHLTTQNDESFIHLRFVFGILVFIVAYIVSKDDEETTVLAVLLIVQALLLIFVNFYRKKETKGLSIAVKEDRLGYSIGKVSKEMLVQEIVGIKIGPNEIVIDRGENRKNYLSFLNLSTDEIDSSKQFFHRILDPKLVIVSN
jgi:HAMP domain-containing protein